MSAFSLLSRRVIGLALFLVIPACIALASPAAEPATGLLTSRQPS